VVSERVRWHVFVAVQTLFKFLLYTVYDVNLLVSENINPNRMLYVLQYILLLVKQT
jgi:hypothetical protein